MTAALAFVNSLRPQDSGRPRGKERSDQVSLTHTPGFSHLCPALDKIVSECQLEPLKPLIEETGRYKAGQKRDERSQLPCPGDLPLSQRPMAVAGASFCQGGSPSDTASFITRCSNME